MGPGDIFWERFGHDAIVVDDPARGEPVSYNFGFFDLGEDGFVGRFVKGEMQYMLVALPLREDLQYYRETGRGAILQWLELEPAQARRLADELAENARPENARWRSFTKSNSTPRQLKSLQKTCRRASSTTGSGRSNRLMATLESATAAPTPSASVPTPSSVKPGRRANCRTARRASPKTSSTALRPQLSRARRVSSGT